MKNKTLQQLLAILKKIEKEERAERETFELIESIEGYCKAHHISKTVFMKQNGYGTDFFCQIKKGRLLRAKTRAEIEKLLKDENK